MIELLREDLEEVQAKNLYRKLRTLEDFRGTHARLDQKEILLFCGNDYLGLSQNPRVIHAAKKAADSHGIGSGAARLISGTTDLHTQLEEKIASFKNKERALLFTTGYLANLGILTALAGEEDLVVMDKLCHASLIDGARLSGATVRVFPHKNYDRCEEILGKAGSFKKRILVSDTVFSMDGDLADLERLVQIKEKYDCLLVMDDAHGTGVMGLTGRGAAEDLKLEDKIDVVMGTLSKALGCLGGFAVGSKTVIDYLINFSRPFIFATALPPMLCAAALEAITVIGEEPGLRHKLWRNAQKIHEGLRGLGFEIGPISSPIFPIILGQEEAALRASELLLEEGILIPAIRSPTVPKGKARLRLTVSAAHEGKDISRVLSALSLIKKVSLCIR